MDNPSKPGPSDESRALKMGELEVHDTELGYVTGVDEQEGKFFIQLTKFTNKELEDHNKLINDHCVSEKQKLKARQSTNLFKPQVGDVLCARYEADGNWYRTVVKTSNDETQESQVYFADYGNVISVKYGDLLQVLPSELPTIARTPFGFYGKIKESKNVPDKKRLLYAISEEYILIKAKERLDFNLWLVELPNIAYNQAFLNTLRLDCTVAQ